MPFGPGQTDASEGRGTIVGQQVKADVDSKSGKVTISCSVFRDLGYGRAFNLKYKVKKDEVKNEKR